MIQGDSRASVPFRSFPCLCRGASKSVGVEAAQTYLAYVCSVTVVADGPRSIAIAVRRCVASRPPSSGRPSAQDEGTLSMRLDRVLCRGLKDLLWRCCIRLKQQHDAIEKSAFTWW